MAQIGRLMQHFELDMGVYTDSGAHHRSRLPPEHPGSSDALTDALVAPFVWGRPKTPTERPTTPNVAVLALRRTSREATLSDTGVTLALPGNAANTARPRSPWSGSRGPLATSNLQQQPPQQQQQQQQPQQPQQRMGTPTDGRRPHTVSVVMECNLRGEIEYISPTLTSLFRYARVHGPDARARVPPTGRRELTALSSPVPDPRR